jgi:hypothetical protein
MKHRRLLNILIFTTFFIFPFSALAANYYVKTPANGGNNTNSGLSWDSAKATIEDAMALAATGDSVFVAAGVYSEKVSFPQGDGIALRGGYPPSGGGVQDPSAHPSDRRFRPFIVRTYDPGPAAAKWDKRVFRHLD